MNMLEICYKFRSKCARLRGQFHTSASATFTGDRSRLHIGRRVSWVIAPGEGCRVDLASSKEFATSELNPAFNSYMPRSTQIGVAPHWRFLNPAQSRDTRVLLQRRATLRCFENVSIAPGVYLSVGNQGTLSIGAHSYIGHDSQINCRSSISIGEGCLIAQRVQIMDYDGHPIVTDDGEYPEETYGGSDGPIQIGNGVWIGFGAMIFKGVVIGEGAIIGAGACVRKDVPPHSMVIGNPATVVKLGVSWRKF